MKRWLGILLLWPSLAAAQALPLDRLTPAFPTATERQAADVASWGTAIASLALDTKASWDCPQRLSCFEREGLRVGLVYGIATVVKLAVHRSRPCAPSCGIDNPTASFFSAHTAIAFSTLGGARLSVSLPLSSATGALRIGADKHWLTDVLVGAGVGSLLSRVR